jgi:hypothetical protein
MFISAVKQTNNVIKKIGDMIGGTAAKEETENALIS